jgi:hypothetical protein
MKKRLPTLVAIGLGISLLTARAGTADTAATTGNNLPGQQFAHTISLITGVAISPLMGVSAVGAWQYFHAKTPEQKARLPWFANPMFWVPALLLVGACFVKDSAGVALPAVLKKPFDVAETIEHKISGLVATGAFVPIAASIFHSTGGSGGGAGLSAAGLAAIDLSWLYNSLMVPVAMVAFFIVFLASNAINILILLSPFTVFDAALKAFRTAIIASIVVSSWANPWIGAAWALIIIAFCYLIAGWSFRLSHFGLVFVWDFVTRRGNRFTPDLTANKMFLGRKINRVPARSYGKLSRDEKGRLVFNYRPWLVLSARTLALPEAQYAVGKGVFFSEIFQLDGDSERIALLLPPRYRSHEEQLVAIYNFVDARPTGLHAVWQWVKSLFGGKTPTTAA